MRKRAPEARRIEPFKEELTKLAITHRAAVAPLSCSFLQYAMITLPQEKKFSRRKTLVLLPRLEARPRSPSRTHGTAARARGWE
jgi:hypothetical protein